MSNIPQLADELVAILAGMKRVVVAFSGGVDSAVVCHAAKLACGTQALAITGASPSIPPEELEQAAVTAATIGIRHQILRTEEFANPSYLSNPSNRCYHCKSELYHRIQRQLRQENDVDSMIVNGTNYDDLGDYRPGLVAAQEVNVRSPLAELRIGKSDVRELARLWKLDVWDKPASPCLSSRVAYGIAVTPERLERVHAAERFLRKQFDSRELRVRVEAREIARIEVPCSILTQIVERRADVISQFKVLGFRGVTLDLEGFRSGSMNEQLVVLQTPALTDL